MENSSILKSNIDTVIDVQVLGEFSIYEYLWILVDLLLDISVLDNNAIKMN